MEDIRQRRVSTGETAAIILAAGQGSRMHSQRTKVLHQIAGVEMILHVVRSVRDAGFDRVYVVVGYQGEHVKAVLHDVTCVEQAEQLGTGHAVDQCRTVLEDFAGPVLVTYGDTPLFQSDTFRELLKHHVEENAAATIVTAHLDDPAGYGRVMRESAGNVLGIVEHKDATEEQRRIQEINTGTYCFDSQLLFRYLKQITPHNAQAEYYLPDVLPLMIEEGHKVAGYMLSDAQESMGVNDRVQLAEAQRVMQRRICEKWMQAGVTIIDPESTFIEMDCVIGQDTVIYPQTFIQQGTKIGPDCQIGPCCRIARSEIGKQVKLESSIIVECVIGDQIEIDPFSHLTNCRKMEG